MADRVKEVRQKVKWSVKNLIRDLHPAVDSYDIEGVLDEVDTLIAAVREEERWQTEYRVGKVIHNTRKAVIAEVRESVLSMMGKMHTPDGALRFVLDELTIISALTPALRNKDTDTHTPDSQANGTEGDK